MNKTLHYDCFTVNVVVQMYNDAVSFFKDGVSRQVFHEQFEEAKLLFYDGAPYVDILVKRNGSITLHRKENMSAWNDTDDVVFRYEMRMNAHQLFDVARYDYRDEIVEKKDVKGEEYDVEYKGTTYVFDNAYERDLAESMSRLIKRRGDDVSGTEFGYMIKYVFRLLGVESNWL